MSSSTIEAMKVTDCVAAIGGALSRVDYDDLALLTDRQHLELLEQALEVSSRVSSLVHTVVAAAERAEAAQTAHGTSTVSWMAGRLLYTRREASAIVHRARDLSRFSDVGDALRDGCINAPQAQAVAQVLAKLPPELGTTVERQAQATMLGFAGQFDSQGLRGLSHHLLDVVAPEVADEAEAKRHEREYRQAQRNRQLVFSSDGHGSTLIRGSLPTADAALLEEQIDAIASRRHRAAVELRDLAAEELTWPMRRADALIELARMVAAGEFAPKHGGDRPHLVITLGYEQLLADCRKAGLPDGTVLTPGQLRQWACDAGVIPVVLGGPSGVLDVGRSQRLVTTDIRRALQVRDVGCVFPGCDRPSADCDAHHIRPWHDEGTTCLTNLCLLCRHHHALVEPGSRPDVLRWVVRIAEDGVPEVVPPRFVDESRRPIRHQRFRLLDRPDPPPDG